MVNAQKSEKPVTWQDLIQDNEEIIFLNEKYSFAPEQLCVLKILKSMETANVDYKTMLMHFIKTQNEKQN